MGDLEKRIKLELEIHIQDEKTSTRLIYFMSLALIIIFNLATFCILWFR